MENIPSKIGKYRIESLLGSGGMGRVYKAIDPDIPAEVALKVIRPELLQGADKDQLLKRFRNEVIACRRVKHPNIVATYDYHESGDTCYIVMEYVPGKLLSDRLDARYSFDLEEILAIMKQLLSALQCAHGNGVTHRDIKPSNIMINDEGIIQVTDFGIAKLTTSELTLTGTIIGSPAYMSPEQCLGKPVDKRSDIFSAGIVLYQLLTGEKPFSSENPASTIQKIVNATIVHPSLLNNSINPVIDEVLDKALAKNPNDRFPSADEFCTALVRACAKTSKPLEKQNRPQRLMIIAGGALLGLLMVLAVLNKDMFFPPETTTIDMNRVNLLLQKFDCSGLKATQNSNGDLFVSGFAKSEDVSSLRTQLEALVGQSGLNTSIRPLEEPFCMAIPLLNPYMQLNQTGNKPLKIKPYQHLENYVEGETIQLEIVTPEKDVYIYADYVQSDGIVFHLYPANEQENTLNKGKIQFVLGEGDNKWEVVAPFGKDLVSIIASEKPLFDFIREPSENAADYFSELKVSLNNAEKDSIMADFFYLTTGPVTEK